MGQNDRIEHDRRLGRTTTPGGAAGANQPQTLDGTVRALGPYPAGTYTLECDVKGYALQTTAAIVGALPTATVVKNEGVICPANSEIEFVVEGLSDAYLIYVADSAAGTIRVNDRSRGKTS